QICQILTNAIGAFCAIFRIRTWIMRQKSSLKHLKSVLEKLEEVQLTGDIFFPKGWLASSIGNYSSKEAYEILQDFLTENPKYNPILLKKIQQTTDNLIRAQSIKK
uniref:hypothetical protein n=1 Tax=Polaribacter sp. TaxID=1920175 RepID=UPI00404828E4